MVLNILDHYNILWRKFVIGRKKEHFEQKTRKKDRFIKLYLIQTFPTLIAIPFFLFYP